MTQEILQQALIERCHKDAADRDCPYFARDTLTKAADMLAAIAQPVPPATSAKLAETTYHLRQYGNVTKEQLTRYIATGDINPVMAKPKPVTVQCEPVTNIGASGWHVSAAGKCCIFMVEDDADEWLQENGAQTDEPEDNPYGSYTKRLLVEQPVAQPATSAKPDQEGDAIHNLREAVYAVLSNEDHAFSGGMRSYQKGSQTWQVYEDLRIAAIASQKGPA